MASQARQLNNQLGKKNFQREQEKNSTLTDRQTDSWGKHGGLSPKKRERERELWYFTYARKREKEENKKVQSLFVLSLSFFFYLGARPM